MREGLVKRAMLKGLWEGVGRDQRNHLLEV